ncbi:hypothetical protein EJ02DRAFT_432663 [Clathrospora elynae]|uniref:Uncharacterized protein n=1 Tax=Clathrospora elynae TaxID=706981 RepID=A0A6A5SWL5_9PLEO|nr:hypothetical protein EJ02DRAFT_432663 [Clathrospora elynae]
MEYSDDYDGLEDYFKHWSSKRSRDAPILFPHSMLNAEPQGRFLALATNTHPRSSTSRQVAVPYTAEELADVARNEVKTDATIKAAVPWEIDVVLTRVAVYEWGKGRARHSSGNPQSWAHVFSNAGAFWLRSETNLWYCDRVVPA